MKAHAVGAAVAVRDDPDDRRAVRHRAVANRRFWSALYGSTGLCAGAFVHERTKSYPMRTRHAVTVRTLGRWGTFWLLCRIGCADVALVLAIQLLKERLDTWILS